MRNRDLHERARRVVEELGLEGELQEQKEQRLELENQETATADLNNALREEELDAEIEGENEQRLLELEMGGEIEDENEQRLLELEMGGEIEDLAQSNDAAIKEELPEWQRVVNEYHEQVDRQASEAADEYLEELDQAEIDTAYSWHEARDLQMTYVKNARRIEFRKSRQNETDKLFFTERDPKAVIEKLTSMIDALKNQGAYQQEIRLSESSLCFLNRHHNNNRSQARSAKRSELISEDLGGFSLNDYRKRLKRG